VTDTPAQKKTRAKNWSSSEDALLSTAWVNASENPITGTDQKVTDFWNTVSVNLSGLKAEEESTIH
jgi:hypothetical protein